MQLQKFMKKPRMIFLFFTYFLLEQIQPTQLMNLQRRRRSILVNKFPWEKNKRNLQRVKLISVSIEVHGSFYKIATWVLNLWERLMKFYILKIDKFMKNLDFSSLASLIIASLFLSYNLLSKLQQSLQKVFRQVFGEHSILKSILISLKRLSLLINGDQWSLQFASYTQLFKKEESLEL